jgi:hypothetical protein
MRLVDADELIEHAWRDKLDSRELIVKMIEQAPTIKEIPTTIPIDIFEKLVLQEQKTDSWTPVSEGLPNIHDYGEEYLVTLKRGGIHIAMFIECDGKHWWTYDDVVAWMPLPASYEPQKEGGKE